MIISDKEKIIKTQKKLTEEPELRRLTITPEGNLFMEGNRKYIWQNYLLFSPRGSFWSISGEHYPPTSEVQEAIPIALLTEKKLFINLPFDSYCYISPKNPPQEEDFFLMLILAPEFSEFIYMDGNLNAPLRLIVNSSKQDQIVGLVITLTKLYNKNVGECFRQCYEQGATFS